MIEYAENLAEIHENSVRKSFAFHCATKVFVRKSISIKKRNRIVVKRILCLTELEAPLGKENYVKQVSKRVFVHANTKFTKG